MLETDTTGCEGEVVRTVQILEVDNVDGLDSVKLELVPNPARGRVLFDWGASDVQQANVALYDVLGAEVLQTKTSAWLDLEGIAPGRYRGRHNGPRPRDAPLMVVEMDDAKGWPRGGQPFLFDFGSGVTRQIAPEARALGFPSSCEHGHAGPLHPSSSRRRRCERPRRCAWRQSDETHGE